MKALRTVTGSVVAAGLCFAALTPARGQNTIKVPVQLQPAEPPRSDPKWVESMQRVVKDLTDENAKLRAENEELRGDVAALKRKLEAYEAQALKWQENRGTLNLVVPPDAVRSTQPRDWRPFQFNGQTYYVIPCKDGQLVAGQAARGPVTRLLVEPAPKGQ
jgi:hypothetical protein